MSKNLTTKQRFIPNISNEFKTNEDFQTLLKQAYESQVKEGSIVQGKVVATNKDFIIVDVGLKNEGIIPISEFALSPETPLPVVGEYVEVYVDKIEGRNGRTILSREKAIREEAWKYLEKAFEAKQNVDGVIFGRVKGGFTVDLSGVVAFLPGSQVDVNMPVDVNVLMNVVQPFQILKMDHKLGNIVVSRKAILESELNEQREKMFGQIQEGMVLEGTVKNIVAFGAFIDLGWCDALLHVTDISWTRVNHPSEILSIGQKIKVKVIKFSPETKRISLGMKQLEANPWESIGKEFAIGKKMHGKITNIADYGVFIELKPGIEGLVHNSEISWTKLAQNRKTIVIGQEVEFVILDIDVEKHRISLSIKQCTENPWQLFADAHKAGDVIKAPIRNITDFGMFVAITSELDGMIHESDISWETPGTEMLKNYKPAQEIECKILAINVAKERVSLGIKQLEKDPIEDELKSMKPGDMLSCTVKDINDNGITVLATANQIEGFISKTNTGKQQDLSKFNVGDHIEAKIVNVQLQTRSLDLSLKY